MKPAKPRSLKENNRKTILNYLRTSQEITVNDIHKFIGLSKTTVMKIINFYAEHGFVMEKGKGESTDEGGKKPILYRFNENAGFAAGIHIFPDEIFIILTDLRLRILRKNSMKIALNETVTAIVKSISGSITDLISEAGLIPNKCIGIGIGAHGITNFETGTVCVSPHFPSWGRDAPLGKMLEEQIPFKTAIFVDNQIRFQVFAEQQVGLADNKKNVIVIEGGTGLVAGIIVKNEVKRGVHFLAGEIGHMVINPGDREQCSCGGYGCFEVQVSAERLLENAEKVANNRPESPLMRDRVLEKEGIQGIFRLADEGDPAAREVLDVTIRWFAIGLSNIMLMHDPELIVFQGIYASAGNYFITRLRQEVNSIVISDLPKNMEIQYSQLGEERGAIGAAAFAIEEYFSHEGLYSRK